MKKYLFSALLIVTSTFAFTAQAAPVTTISGFDNHHTFIANAGPSVITVEHIDDLGNNVVIPAGVGNTKNNFIHDYVFTAVANAIATVSIGVTVGTTVPNLFMEIVALTPGDLTPNAGPIAVGGASVSLGYQMIKGNDYRVTLLGDGSLAGQYSLTVSTVPVPAAVWLFGSALLGVFGVQRRKAKALIAA